MSRFIAIADGVFELSIDDRRTHLFENLWELHCGVSYNCYMVIGSSGTALLDTVECGWGGDFIASVEAQLGGRELDYLVINHLEPDHSGEIGNILKRYPTAKVVGNGQTRRILAGYYQVPDERFAEIKDGDTVSLGDKTLRFHITPWVHWPETMMTYLVGQHILFSGDSFGTFGTTDGSLTDDSCTIEEFESEMRRYYANIVGKYGAMVQRALGKLKDIPVKMLCPLHGPVWKREAAKVVALYDKWSRYEADDKVVIIYGSMYNNTAQMADRIAERLGTKGVKGVTVLDSSKVDLSELVSQVWRCKYVILGSCAYNGGMFPRMEFLCSTLKSLCVTGRQTAIFGGCSWGGGGVRALSEFVESAGWDKMCEPVEICGLATAEKLDGLDAIADAIVAKL